MLTARLDDSEVVLYALFGLLGLCVILLVAAMLLRAACFCVGVKEPDYAAAMGIVLVVALCGGAIRFLCFAALAAEERVAASPPYQAFVTLLGLSVNMLVAAGFYAAFLDKCSFAKGLLIYLLQIAILFAIILMVLIPYAILIGFGK